MTGAAKWLRPFEIALTVAGVSFLGGAFAATVARWDYQTRQDRAIVRGDKAVDPLRGDKAVDPLVLGRIEIPRIGVRAVVREGVDDATLALAVGHVRGTARPGENGNTVLAGHRDTFFRGLRNIRMHDQVRLVVPPRSYEYRVVSLQVVAPNETKVLDPTKDELVTLVTCYPFSYIGHAPNRFIVRAGRVATAESGH
jgi:sortase A